MKKYNNQIFSPDTQLCKIAFDPKIASKDIKLGDGNHRVKLVGNSNNFIYGDYIFKPGNVYYYEV